MLIVYRSIRSLASMTPVVPNYLKGRDLLIGHQELMVPRHLPQSRYKTLDKDSDLRSLSKSLSRQMKGYDIHYLTWPD